MRKDESAPGTGRSAQLFDPLDEIEEPLQLRNDGDVVIAIPYLLGFRPSESVVALVFDGQKLITTVRFPLAMGDEKEMLANRIATIVRQFSCSGWIFAAYSNDRNRATMMVDAMTELVGSENVLESIYI